MAKPWEVTKVEAAAEAILQRAQFDWNLIDSDDEEADETNEDNSGDEGDSSDGDSDTEIKCLRHKAKELKKLAALKKAGRKTLTRRTIESDDEDSLPKKSAQNKSALVQAKSNDYKEVEDLISQLNSMSLNDPGYGIVYYKAIKLDRDVEKVVKRPLIGNVNENTHVPGFPPRRDPPPHLANQPSVGGGFDQPPMRCYGCGEFGHGMLRCDKIAEMMQTGVLARDSIGRIVKGDGTYLQRAMDKPYVIAIECE